MLLIILIIILLGVYIIGKMGPVSGRKYTQRRFNIRQHRKDRSGHNKEEEEDD